MSGKMTNRCGTSFTHVANSMEMFSISVSVSRTAGLRSIEKTQSYLSSKSGFCEFCNSQYCNFKRAVTSVLFFCQKYLHAIFAVSFKFLQIMLSCKRAFYTFFASVLVLILQISGVHLNLHILKVGVEESSESEVRLKQLIRDP
jgi:hypothetical protein